MKIYFFIFSSGAPYQILWKIEKKIKKMGRFSPAMFIVTFEPETLQPARAEPLDSAEGFHEVRLSAGPGGADSR